MHPVQDRWPFSALCAAALLTAAADAGAREFKASGRVMFGAALRTEAPEPSLLVSYNAREVGLQGFASSGQNTDDANLNFRRGDATTRALHAFVDISASRGSFQALARIKGWHDFALQDHARDWGNNPNGYQAGEPLSDAGAARLSRFSGVALGDAWVQYAPGAQLSIRVGQQSLPWGEQATFAGGLAAINALDQPAQRRAGSAPQQLRVPSPMTFARIAIAPALSLEAFYGATFRPSALDMCGTFWASTDYLAQGCDRAFAGSMPFSDRARLASGAFLKRVDSPSANDGPQFGAALVYRTAALDAGIYAARYTNRIPIPGLRQSTRTGPAFIPGDPDGRNLAFFTEHADDVKLVAVNVAHRRAANTWSAELAYRPNQPVQLPPGDVLPAFLNPAAPSLIRADASATPPGGTFRGYDRLRTAQLQLGWQRAFGVVSAAVDVVGKQVLSLPDPALRRYGRPDQYGTGPINGVCFPNSLNVKRQCSLDGYVSKRSFGYRLRADARLPKVAPRLDLHASAIFTHDVSGWAHDFLLGEGRKSLNLALRMQYRERYLAELAYLPIWSGQYSNQLDKDQLAFAVGVKF